MSQKNRRMFSLLVETPGADFTWWKHSRGDARSSDKSWKLFNSQHDRLPVGILFDPVYLCPQQELICHYHIIKSQCFILQPALAWRLLTVTSVIVFWQNGAGLVFHSVSVDTTRSVTPNVCTEVTECPRLNLAWLLMNHADHCHDAVFPHYLDLSASPLTLFELNRILKPWLWNVKSYISKTSIHWGVVTSC